MAAHRTARLIPAGSRAPEFRLERLDGGETSLQEIIANGPALLAFFKVTCPICQLTFPFLERIYGSGNLPIYGVSQNGPDDTREFARHFRLSLPMLLDREQKQFPASNAYGISSVPTMFLLERDGTISRVVEGWNKSEIEWLGEKAGLRVIRPDDNVPAWKAG